MLSLHTSPLDQAGTGDGGGMNVYVRQLCTALARSGARCDVFTRASAPSQAATVVLEPGLAVHHVRGGPVARVAKEDLAAVVGDFAAGVRRRLTEAPDGLPDALHANYWLSGVAGCLLKRDLGLPLLSTFHTLERVKLAEGQGSRAEEGRARGEAEVVAGSDALLASCAVEAAQLVELYGAEPRRVTVVAPGVEHALFGPGARAQARRALGLPLGIPVVLFVGRLQPLKGADIALGALRALHRHPEALMVVVGGPSGPEGGAAAAQLHALAAERQVAGRVRFVPPQPHELLGSYYRAADVCVVPSRSESFGLVALEAAACGTPVVAASVGGLRTLVDDGVTGWLVRGGDPGDYAAAIDRVLSDDSMAQRMGDAAVRRARRYTWAAAAARMLELEWLSGGALMACG